MDIIKKGFGNCLKNARKSKQLTQEKLTERLGINLRQLARIEAGQSFVTAETLYRICSVLDISPSCLFGFDIKAGEYIKTGTGNVFNNSPQTVNLERAIDNSKYCNAFNTLKNNVLSIADNGGRIEFINTAFRALDDKQSLQELKLLIKGIEIMH